MKTKQRKEKNCKDQYLFGSWERKEKLSSDVKTF